MIPLLQKYQRPITLFISVCVISTFVFFGTSRAFLSDAEKSEDEPLWRDGHVQLTRSQIRERALFISSEITDSSNRQAAWCALLNPGFATQYLFSTGLAVDLINRDEATQQWLKEQLIQEAQWKGYRHPKLGYLNFDALLTQLNPHLGGTIKAWQALAPLPVEAKASNVASELPTPSLAESKIALWLMCKRTPLQAIRTLIRYQEAAVPGSEDSLLATRTMQPFGYQNLQEWFGPRFTYLSVQLLAQGAAKAEALGYKVTLSEAETQISLRIKGLWEGFAQNRGDLTLAAFTQELWKNIGIEPVRLAEFWRELMLFDLLCVDEGARYVVDATSVKEMSEFLAASTLVDSYEIPTSYRVASFRDMCQLQLYWQMTSGLGLSDLAIPTMQKPLLELQRTAPELMVKVAKLQVRHLTFEQICQRLGIKSLLFLQAKDPLWNQLVEQLPPLKASASLAEVKDRLNLLTGLEGQWREKANRIAIQWLSENDPQPLIYLLQAQPAEINEYRLALAALRQPLDGIGSARELVEALAEKPQLPLYTQNQQNFYAFEQLGEVRDDLLSFEEAKTLSILEGVYTKKLQAHYAVMKSNQAPAIFRSGQAQEFKAVQEKVALDLFQGLLVALQHQSAEVLELTPLFSIHKTSEADSISKWRFYAELQRQKQLIEIGESTLGIQPWSLLRKQENYNREAVLHTPLEAIFKLQKGEWLALDVEKIKKEQRSSQSLSPMLDRLIRCVDHKTEALEPYSLADRVHDLHAKAINHQALHRWIEQVKLDTEMAFLSKDSLSQ